MIGQAIRIAGINCHWTAAYASRYCDILNEMGYCARPLKFGSSLWVAYSHRPFSRSELEDRLSKLFPDFKKESDEQIINRYETGGTHGVV